MLEQNWLDESHQLVMDRLKQLIQIPSFSKGEQYAIEWFLSIMEQDGIKCKQIGNNLISYNAHYDQSKPCILLNSHIDTVKPNKNYTLNPFEPIDAQEKIYGLGSNDAGGSLMCLYEIFKHYYHQQGLRYNLIFVCSAEEEISGVDGMSAVLEYLPKIELAIVGEPTEMKMAIAERGLLVIDCLVKGEGGHAAHGSGDNAIYRSMEFIKWFEQFEFPKESDLLGKVAMNVTMIEAGTQHNMIPVACKFTVDIRCTDAYSLKEILEVIKSNVACDIKPRSMRLNPSAIPCDHFVLDITKQLGIECFGSATLSDQALMPFPSVKIGPGNTFRSHTADEFIGKQELYDGLHIYNELLNKILT